MKKVGFVIITWNSENFIKACLESLLQITSFDAVISICDNGSSDRTKEIINDFNDSRIILSTLEKNSGTTISRNIAIRALPEVDYVCILDSDTELHDEEGFARMMEILDSHPEIGILGPRLENKDGVLQYSARNIPTLKEKFYKVLPSKKKKQQALEMEHVDYDRQEDLFVTGYLMSACWLMRREIFEKIGYLDEKIFYAPEDVEFCERAWVNGRKVAYYKKCTVLHHWQRLSRKKLFSKHNLEHIKGLFYLKRKYRKQKFEVK